MQPSESTDAEVPVTPVNSHSKRANGNGNVTGFSHGAFTSNKPVGNFRDRLGGVPASLVTGQDGAHVAEMQTPVTNYELNYTPLLPSQLLMGSPFQPGSPTTFASPHFQNYSNFSPTSQAQNNNMQQAQYYGNFGGNQYYNGQLGLGFNNMQQQFTAMSMSPMGTTSRTVYLGNIPADTPAEEILNHVRSGAIESVRLLPDRNCAFISFLDPSSAVRFHSDAILKKLSIRGQDIKIGWGKPSHIPATVGMAVQQAGASRNVYLGSLPQDISEDAIREDLGKFGNIDTIKLVREKNIGFVHFLTISSAIKAVSQLPVEPSWAAPRRVFYGKDRCAYVSKTQQQNAAQYLGFPSGYSQAINTSERDMISSNISQQSVAAAAVATAAGGASNLGNRTVYLGNIHPETTTEEICNVVRGGLLHHVRYIPDKHICFVTFIDSTAAASFFALSNMQGLMIHNRRLKIGWGKHSQALPPAIALAVSSGASRNVYIGNIDEAWTEERLKQDFSEYGETELVNTLREKSCAFVNFTNIANAIKAIEQVRSREEYTKFKINFGKDRCGNAPRQVHQHERGDLSPAPNGRHGPSPLSIVSKGSGDGDVLANPLQSYLNHIQGQSNRLSPPGVTISRPDPKHAPGALHGQSNSFSINGELVNGNDTALLAPKSSAQHSRAISLPVFGQHAYGVPGQQVQAPQPFAYPSAHHTGLGYNFGLAIQGDPVLPRWAEEAAH